MAQKHESTSVELLVNVTGVHSCMRPPSMSKHISTPDYKIICPYFMQNKGTAANSMGLMFSSEVL